MKFINKVKKFLDIVYLELLIILFPFILFCMSATFSGLNNHTNIVHMILWDMFFVTPFLVIVIIKKKDIMVQLNAIKQKSFPKSLLMVIIISIFIRLLQLGTIPRWDSEAYFAPLINGCKTFSFTLKSFINSFMLAGHQCWGYSLFIASGAYMTPYSIIGINIVNLLLYIVYIICVFKILRKIIKCESDLWISIGTLLVTVEPMQLGTFAHLNLDYPLFIFIIFVLYAHMEHKYLVFIFYSIVLVFTKETGIILLLGYILGYTFFTIITNIICKKNISFIELLNNKAFLSTIITLVTFVLCKSVLNLIDISKMWGNGLKVGNDNLEIKNNYFAINFDYMILKMKTMFVFNFYWLITLLITVICILKVIRIIKSKKMPNINVYLMSYISGIAAMIIFNLLYITYNNPRYNLVIENALFLIFAYFIIKSKKYYVRIFITIICLIWFVMQSYTSIDPISRLIFPPIGTGQNCWIVHPVWNNNPYLADTSVYNNQGDYMDKAFNKILSDVNYNENMDIIIPGEYFLGVRAIYLEGRYMDYYWNKKLNKRTLKNEGEHTILINTLNDDNFYHFQSTNELKPDALAIFVPQYGIDEIEYVKKLNEYYSVGDRKKAKIFGQGEVHYYILKKL